MILAYRSTLVGHGKHPTTGGGGPRSSSGYPIRRGQYRDIPAGSVELSQRLFVTATTTTAAGTAIHVPLPPNWVCCLRTATFGHVEIHPEAPVNIQLPGLLVCQRQIQLKKK